MSKEHNQPPETLSGDSLHWRQVRANKMNQHTAARIAEVRKIADPEHLEVMRDAMQQWANKTAIGSRFPEITDLITSEAVFHLAYCGGDVRYERTVAVMVALAIVKGKSAEQCRKLFISKTAYFNVGNNKTIRRVADFSWSKESISKGDVLVVRLGEVEVGQLISFIHRKRLYINRLKARVSDGLIIVEGNSGKKHALSAGTYKIEGAVIAIQKGARAAEQIAEHEKEQSSKKIEELKEKISRLDYEPENEACYFKLQTELWEIEHPAEEEDSILDAEYISGRGFINREGGAR